MTLQAEPRSSPDRAAASADRAAELLQQMSPAEKYAQMAQVELNSTTADEVRRTAVGSVLSGGGGNPDPNTPAAWRVMVDGFLEAAQQSRLGIPLLYGVDAVHGHNNVYGATIFPHNIGLGAANDAQLVERIGRITAIETAATGVRWTFAPTVAVAQDIRWGRTYESYSQDPAIVGRLAAALVRGLHGSRLANADSVLTSVKHFVGDGGTTWGSSGSYPWIGDWWVNRGDSWRIDQGVCEVDEETLRAVHLAPYIDAIAAGARNVMVSYSSWGGLKMHAQRYLLTDVLKGELGFDGFLVTDWLAVDQLSPDYTAAVATAINAGIDMVMVPFDLQRFLDAMTQAVASGAIPMARVDDAVQRILTVKFELGLFDQPRDARPALDLVGAAAHRALAREAACRSAVLLKNSGALPITTDLPQLLIAGAGADDIGLQCGGWTIEWQGKPGPITVGRTILDGLRDRLGHSTSLQYSRDAAFGDDVRAPLGVLVLSETPYAEGEGDQGDVRLSDEHVTLIRRMRNHCEKVVVILLAGRPLLLTDFLDDFDALVAAWLPGSEADGIADLLTGRRQFEARLSFDWPRSSDQIPRNAADRPLWPIGYGLTG